MKMSARSGGKAGLRGGSWYQSHRVIEARRAEVWYEGVYLTDPMPDVTKLAVEPLYRMLCAREPFDDCPTAHDRLGPVCDRIRAVGYWAYQFHTYLELIEAEHGAATRRQVQQIMLHALDQLDRAGDRLESFLRLTHEAIASYRRHYPRRGGDTGLSVETYLAVTLLVKTPDSPYFSDCADTAAMGELPLQFDVVKDLSRCFKRGAAGVRNHYQERLREAAKKQVH